MWISVVSLVEGGIFCVNVSMVCMISFLVRCVGWVFVSMLFILMNVM